MAAAVTAAVGKLELDDPERKPLDRGNHPASDEEDDNEDHEGDINSAATAATTKKKKKRRPKKKKAPTDGNSSTTPHATSQSVPPRVPISQLFADEIYPVGQEVPYLNQNAYRTTSEEKRALDRSNSEFLTEYRKAAEIHRQVRQHAQQHVILPGRTLTEIAEEIEAGVRALTGHAGLVEGDALVAGMGFPTGLSLNSCAAHYTPNSSSEPIVYRAGDVLKVDFGVHVNGRILDSAFTVCTDERLFPLLTAAREATEAGVREAGIDARMADIGAAIQEVMESYEVQVPSSSSSSGGLTGGSGKTERVRCIRNLNGHNIDRFRIHGGKSVPIVRSPQDTDRMEEGETYAIETFGSTGRGVVHEQMETSHYAKFADVPAANLRLASAKSLYGLIGRNFGTLPFCRRYLDRLGAEKYLLGLNSLVAQGVVQAYPPLCDVKGSYTAQFEHTILLRPNCKEVISRGDDY